MAKHRYRKRLAIEEKNNPGHRWPGEGDYLGEKVVIFLFSVRMVSFLLRETLEIRLEVQLDASFPSLDRSSIPDDSSKNCVYP